MKDKIRRNYESDISFIETFGVKDADGEFTPVIIHDNVDFEIECWAQPGNGAAFTASRINGKYKYCEKLDDSRVKVYIPLSRCFLGDGYLCRKLRFRLPEQGWNREPSEICAPYQTEYWLWDGASDDCELSFEEEVTIIGAFKGADGLSVYELAVKHGFEGTEEEWLESQLVAGNMTGTLCVLAHTDCTLDQRVSHLEQLISDLISGREYIPSLRVRDLEVWGKDLGVLTGTGAPTRSPDKAGQFYIDTQNRVLYFATGNTSIADWK